MVIKIVPNDKGNPAGKLADAELHFTEGELQGSSSWDLRCGSARNGPGRNVTFPARNYAVNGARRSYALLRSDGNDTQVQDRVRDLILQAYDDIRRRWRSPADWRGGATRPRGCLPR